MNFEHQIRLASHELIEKGNLNFIDELFSKNYIAHNNGKIYKGHAFIKRWLKQLRSAIPDIRIIKIDFYIHEENKIAWKRTLSGTHKYQIKGIPPSQKKVSWDEMIISHFTDNKIAEDIVVSGFLGELLLRIPGKN